MSTLRVASVARTVSVTSQLYYVCLRCQSCQGTVEFTLSTAFCDTISLNTDAILIDIIIRRYETVRRHHRSVCQSTISLPHALQASRQSLMGHHGVEIFDNRKKIIFKQMIIDFQEKKTILTSVISPLV